MYLLYLFIITSFITLLQIDNPHAVAVDSGIAIKPIPVRDNVIELDVVAIITNVLNDFNIVVYVLYFLYFFLDLLFFSLTYVVISLILSIEILKLLMSIPFFSSLCYKSNFFNGAERYILSAFASI